MQNAKQCITTDAFAARTPMQTIKLTFFAYVKHLSKLSCSKNLRLHAAYNKTIRRRGTSSKSTVDRVMAPTWALWYSFDYYGASAARGQ